MNDLGDYEFDPDARLTSPEDWNKYGIKHPMAVSSRVVILCLMSYQVGKACEVLYNTIRKPVQDGQFLLNLGGDHR